MGSIEIQYQLHRTVRPASTSDLSGAGAHFGASAAMVSDASAFLEDSCAQRVVGTGDL